MPGIISKQKPASAASRPNARTAAAQRQGDNRPSEHAPPRVVAFSRSHPVPERLLKNLRYEYLKRELWIPLAEQDGRITVVVDDPRDLLKRDMIENLLKTADIDYCVALKRDILDFIDFFFGIEEAPENGRRADLHERKGPAPPEKAPAITESDSQVVQLVHKAILDACAQRASDIHIEPDPRDKEVVIRFRIDGECLPYKVLPIHFRAPIVSRIKIMANLDITERRLPQDGKIRFERPGAEDVELRVATIPTYGYVEDVVMRILTRGRIRSLDELHMSCRDHDQFLRILRKPYGLILIVGPTGSGKTTTAHAALQLLNKPNVKIWTAEDPVEITQKGLRQVQVHHKIGFDFGNAMRAFLRADPDIILVGEMRDYETAKMGIEASTTGHLVMSTLHTNNAPETIIRLLDMGIDPFAFADSLLCVLAQRLVRLLCPFCREPYHPPPEERAELIRLYEEKYAADLGISSGASFPLYRARGCVACNQTGYRERTGVYELLVATDELKHMIVTRQSIQSIRQAAMADGMRTLLQDGIAKIVKGETDLTEVLGVCLR